MNIGIIFAGGSGTRMNSKSKPKQFLEVNGKPIIIHTLEIFEEHNAIDAIVVVCLEGWITYLNDLLDKFRIKKVRVVVPGGETGQLSIYNGLEAAEKIADEKSIVLIHDGVRPLIDGKVISDNIEAVKTYGSAITSSIVKETIMVVDEKNEIEMVPSREKSRIAKAPQSFYLEDIISVHRQAIKDKIFNSIDSCTLMKNYNKRLVMINGPYENIKITTPDDFYTLRALLEAKENSQIFGY